MLTYYLDLLSDVNVIVQCFFLGTWDLLILTVITIFMPNIVCAAWVRNHAT